MPEIKIEFFHDVLCSYCFPMSYRMRRVKAKMPELSITHRAYILIESERDYKRMFGSREEAKNTIVKHWEDAARYDELKRFNAEGMMKTAFPFPTSMPPLRACKAALSVAGEEAEWDLFDSLQMALYSENLNLEDEEVLKSRVSACGINVEAWLESYHSSLTRDAVITDMNIADLRGVEVVPSLVMNGRVILSGLKSPEEIERAIRTAQDAVETQTEGAACHFVDGKWKCD